MGIFDDYQFDPSSYSVSPSGWLGRLLQAPPDPTQGAVPTQPLASVTPPWGGAPSQAAGSLAPPAPPSAGKGAGASVATAPGPGAAAAFGKDAVSSNPFTDFVGSLGNGIGNALSPYTPSALQAAPSLLDRLSAGATNLSTGGNPLAGIVNSVRGLASGQRTDAAGAAQAGQIAALQALVGAGVPPQLAQLAAVNPDLLRQVVATRFNTPPAPAAASPAANLTRAQLEAEARRRGLIQ